MKYNPAPIPNTGPPPPYYVIEFDKKFAGILTACARKVGGACGVSTGINGQTLVVGGRFSLDGYIDQEGRCVYYFTTAVGFQVSAKPLGISGSNMYIVAPGTSATDFKGLGSSAGGSASAGLRAAVDLVFTITDTGPKPIAFAIGTQNGINAEVHSMVSYSFVLYDSQNR